MTSKDASVEFPQIARRVSDGQARQAQWLAQGATYRRLAFFPAWCGRQHLGSFGGQFGDV